jgi:hypothetical protein
MNVVLSGGKKINTAKSTNRLAKTNEIKTGPIAAGQSLDVDISA